MKLEIFHVGKITIKRLRRNVEVFESRMDAPDIMPAGSSKGISLDATKKPASFPTTIKRVEK